MQRILTAAGALIVVAVLLDLGAEPVVWSFIGILGILALGEWDLLARTRGWKPLTPFTAAALVLLEAWGYAMVHGNPGPAWRWSVLGLPFFVVGGSWFRWRNPQLPFDAYVRDLAWSLFGLAYLGTAVLAMSMIYELQPPGADPARLWDRPILGWLLPIFAADTFAYYGGRRTGKRKLAARISPGKTWEGFAWGVLGAGLAAGLLQHWWAGRWTAPLPRYGWVGFALLAGVLGPLGDLLESALKRWAAVKDSSRLLPGHGGVLDRLDSLLVTAPFYFIYWLAWYPFQGHGPPS